MQNEEDTQHILSILKYFISSVLIITILYFVFSEKELNVITTNEKETYDELFVIRGTTPGNGKLSINDKEVKNIDEKFHEVFPLQLGLNSFIVKYDDGKKTKQKTINITKLDIRYKKVKEQFNPWDELSTYPNYLYC